MSDPIRDEFEAWAKANSHFDISRVNNPNLIFYDQYKSVVTDIVWRMYQVAYAAGRKAEREELCIQWEGADATIAEVERLRTELAQLRKDWCDDDEQVKQQALRVLDAKAVEGDSVYVPRMGALAEMMANEIERVRASEERMNGIVALANDGMEQLRGEVFFHSEASKGLIAELAERKAENDRLKAELAAAKAEVTKLDDQYRELACAVWASPFGDEAITASHEETVEEAEQDVVRVAKLSIELAAAEAASVVPVEIIRCDPDIDRTATVVFWSNADSQRFADWLRERMKGGEG